MLKDCSFITPRVFGTYFLHLKGRTGISIFYPISFVTIEMKGWDLKEQYLHFFPTVLASESFKRKRRMKTLVIFVVFMLYSHQSMGNG